MTEFENPYRTWGTIAANADVDERAGFIRQTYLHLAGAIAAFAAIEAVLLNIPGIENTVFGLLQAMPFSWLIVMGAFIGVSWIADRWAKSSTSVATQYMGLGLYVVAEAVIFLPLLLIAQMYGESFVGGLDVISAAGLLTVFLFVGLTTIVFTTGADFSFLRNGLILASVIAMGAIVASILMGFNLGVLFSAVMIAVASGWILYDTSNIMHHYRIGQHVAASLALFASVALLFWYILQLVMSLSSRD